MTTPKTPNLTPETAIAIMTQKLENNIETLLMVRGALSCLSNMALHATKDDQIIISNLGCLIWLCDHQMDHITDEMLLQLDEAELLLQS